METGELVLATRWSDGDPKDPWMIGFYNGNHYNGKYDVFDTDGVCKHGQGFRRIEKISPQKAWFFIQYRNYIITYSSKSVYAIMRMKNPAKEIIQC